MSSLRAFTPPYCTHLFQKYQAFWRNIRVFFRGTFGPMLWHLAEALLYDKPVFFDLQRFSTEPFVMFPEILFHPGFLGVEDFIDEPAWLLWRDSSHVRLARDLRTMGQVQEKRTLDVLQRKREGRQPSLMRRLAEAGIDLRGIELSQPPIPIWEEFYDTACYQLRAPVPGFIHEGRYQHPEVVDLLNATFRTRLPRTPETMFRFYYAFLRGAARVFRKDWGMSIYGQADPDIAALGMRMAYDRGAKYIWFWTSDRDNHLPFEEQIALARELSTYAREHPRRDRRVLINAVEDAIVLPYGFTFSISDWDKSRIADLWHRTMFSLKDGQTADGVPYYAILRCAAMKMEELVKSGREFDIVVDTPELKHAGYSRLHRVIARAREKRYTYPRWIHYKLHLALAVLVGLLAVSISRRAMRRYRARRQDDSRRA